MNNNCLHGISYYSYSWQTMLKCIFLCFSPLITFPHYCKHFHIPYHMNLILHLNPCLHSCLRTSVWCLNTDVCVCMHLMEGFFFLSFFFGPWQSVFYQTCHQRESFSSTKRSFCLKFHILRTFLSLSFLQRPDGEKSCLMQVQRLPTWWLKSVLVKCALLKGRTFLKKLHQWKPSHCEKEKPALFILLSHCGRSSWKLSIFIFRLYFS